MGKDEIADSCQQTAFSGEQTAGRKKSSQRRLLRAVVTWKDGAYHAIPAGIQSPGALKSMVVCNSLIDIPAEHGPLQAGEKVKAVLLPPLYCLGG